MKLNKILESTNQQIVLENTEQFFESIKRECSDYLRNGVTLYRGMIALNDLGQGRIEQRKSSTIVSSPFTTFMFNKIANDRRFNSGIPVEDIRTKSLFTTRNMRHVQQFGDPFIIFPVNGSLYGGPTNGVIDDAGGPTGMIKRITFFEEKIWEDFSNRYPEVYAEKVIGRRESFLTYPEAVDQEMMSIFEEIIDSYQPPKMIHVSQSLSDFDRSHANEIFVTGVDKYYYMSFDVFEQETNNISSNSNNPVEIIRDMIL